MRGWRSTVRAAATLKLGWWIRFSPVLGLFIMATSTGPWWLTLIWGVMWSLSAQLGLFIVWTQGWLVGFAEASPKDNLTVNMGDFMDLCDEHGVPPEKVARMIWGDDDE